MRFRQERYSQIYILRVYTKRKSYLYLIEV